MQRTELGMVPLNNLFQLPDSLAANLEGFAAPFANWFLFRPARALLDAGEGIASRLGNEVFVPEVILLTHAHADHVLGLTGFLMARTTAMGNREKPLTIYYPRAAEPDFQAVRARVSAAAGNLSYPLAWQGVEPGERISLRHWTVQPFATRHSVPSCGYRFLEGRRRLKAEFRDRSGPEIVALKAGGLPITEDYEHVALAFTGDTGPGLDPDLFRDADVLIHEATFLDPEDREGTYHATAEEAFDLAVRANVKTLVLYHISQRYRRAEIEQAVTALQRRTGYAGRLTVVAGYTPAREFY
jgi:ribonuclease Z